jgi:S1-C subfamily serine protease
VQPRKLREQHRVSHLNRLRRLLISSDSSTAANPGNGGGPVLDSDGYAVGIFRTVLTTQLGLWGIPVIIPADFRSALMSPFHDRGLSWISRRSRQVRVTCEHESLPGAKTALTP